VDHYVASRAHLVVVLAGCVAMTALATSNDDEAAWLLGTAVALVPVILIAARDQHIADYLRGWPAGSRLCLVLVAVAVGAGLLDIGAADLVGLLSTTVLIYLAVVLFGVWSPIRRRRQ
jgi:uncharacterized membrane protein AbrB (regulator of aidB expression)